MEQHDKGQFKTNFGFLMAAIGSAVGLGNLWGFPYKMGKGGGFAFLILYLILFIFIGYPLMLSEFAIGRKSGKGALGAYKHIDKKWAFNGWFAFFTPIMLIMFYCYLGGMGIKYLIANLGDIFGAGFGIGATEAGDYFGAYAGSAGETLLFGLIFLVLTIVIVMAGVQGGIERFSAISMPALFVMLVITVIRSVTLPGAMEGVAFIFKPDLSVFRGSGILSILASAGGQLFFSLSLASGAQIAYASYLSKNEDLERNAFVVPIADTLVGVLAGLATMPALFAAGLEPTAGPGLLFISLQTAFKAMGGLGPFFGALFYLLVFLAALSSSIAMMEGAVSVLVDLRMEKGLPQGRREMALLIGAVALIGTVVCAFDKLGGGTLPHIGIMETWLDSFDLIGEGFLMPLGGLFTAIILGWANRDYIDDEIKLSSGYKSKPFVDFCLRYPAIIFMVFILIGQMNDFFGLGLW